MRRWVALKKLRAAAGMTQEELADRAGISARTVSDVERGLRMFVHGDTARRLVAALRLSEQDSARFDAVARGAVQTTDPPGDLPVPLTRLLGRSRELADVFARVQDPQVRPLTLTGPGASARPGWRWRRRPKPERCSAGGLLRLARRAEGRRLDRARAGQGDRRGGVGP